MPSATRTELRCSFCHRTQRDVRVLLAGPFSYICEGCIATAAEIVEKEYGPLASLKPTEPPSGYHTLTAHVSDAALLRATRERVATLEQQVADLTASLARHLAEKEARETAAADLLARGMRITAEARPSGRPE